MSAMSAMLPIKTVITATALVIVVVIVPAIALAVVLAEDVVVAADALILECRKEGVK